MSASTRRKKVKPVSDGRITFTLVIDAQKMVVDYRPYWMSDYGQFEFRSPHDPARRIHGNCLGNYVPHHAWQGAGGPVASP